MNGSLTTIIRTCECGRTAAWTTNVIDPEAYRLVVAASDGPGRGSYLCDKHAKRYDIHDGVVLP